MPKRTTEVPPTESELREEAWHAGIQGISSNLVPHLVNSVHATRFFKIMRREDNSWLAVLGSSDDERLPVVAFGNGGTITEALYRLGKTLAAEDWRDDKFA